MRTLIDERNAPLPPFTPTVDHVADIWFAPHIAVLGTCIPPEVEGGLLNFRGEHLSSRRIDGSRVATAWIGRNAMWGGESTGMSKGAEATSQFHPATIHWRTQSGRIGWLRLVESPAVDAIADKRGLTIRTR